MLTTAANPALWLLALIAAIAGTGALAGHTPARVRERLIGLFTATPLLVALMSASLAGAAARTALGARVAGEYADEVVAARSFLADRRLYAADPARQLDLVLAENPSAVPSWAMAGLSPCQADALEGPARFYSSRPHSPFLLLMSVPVVATMGARGYYFLIAALSMVSCCAIAMALAHAVDARRRSRVAVALAAALLGWQPVLASIRTGDIAVIIAALLVAGWLAVRAGHQRRAGLVLGAAASLQPLALVTIVWLARRAPRAALTALGVVSMAAAITVAGAGAGVFSEFLAVVRESARTYAAAPQNYAPLSKLAWLLPGDLTIGLAVVLILGISLAVTFARPAIGELRHAADRELGVFAAAVLLISPVAWSHHVAVLALPLALLWAARWPGRPAWLAILALAAIAVSLPDYPALQVWGFVGAEVGPAAAVLAAGTPAWAAAAIWGWLVAERLA